MLLDQILIHVPCPIFWKDLDGAFLGCNKVFLEISGFSDYSQLIGKTDAELPWKAYKDEYYKDDQHVITTGATITRIENIPLKGRVIISETTKTPLLQDGKTIGVLGICLDITDRKEKEHALLENQIHQATIIEEQEKFKKAVGQMVHDIRTPLSTLQMTLQSTMEIPEEKRLTLRNAAITITDIAGDLLRQYEPTTNVSNEGRQIVLVSTLLASVIGDRRHKYRDLAIKFDYEINQENAFTFIKVEALDFKRAISNLINNAVEALPAKGGIIKLRLDYLPGVVKILIEDNGSGIPDEVLDKINNRELITHGKQNGHGLGLSVVYDMLERNHGEIEIYSATESDSYDGSGTTIQLKFPTVTTPDWVLDEINLLKDNIVVILDDDSSIHKGWDSRLSYILEKITTLTVKHFTNGVEALAFIENLSAADKEKVYLMSDYELIGQELNGLEIIAQAEINRYMLVTSHYANISVRKTASQNNVKILPKDLVHIVPIKVVQESNEAVHVHMVFVDDVASFTRELVTNYYSHLLVESYTNPLKFLAEFKKYAKDTIFVLDNMYSMEDNSLYEVDGIDLARQLYANGYTQLILLSGEQIKTPEYVKFVLKNDQDGIAKLNKMF